MSRPLVAVIGGQYEAKFGSVVYGMLASYFKALSQAGAAPILVAPNIDADAQRLIFERCDGVLLAGGPDVNPVRYHMSEDYVEMKWVNDLRDQAEISYTQWAVAEDKPMLAICRGHQVANVALGGTLYRDIPAEYPDHVGVDHSATGDGARTRIVHTVEVLPDSRLASILGTHVVEVNSLHHQALRTVAPRLKVTGYAAPDHLIEAVEIPEARFFVGVQWHPEEMVDFSAPMRNLFSGFVAAC